MRMYTERRSDNFRRSQRDSQSAGKIIANSLESHVPMSSKTQFLSFFLPFFLKVNKRGNKIQPLKTVELSEYQKIYYQIYMYKPQECQRQKGCC